MKAHLTYDDVETGQVSYFDWMGNAAADALAVAGARNWSAHSGARQRAWQRALVTISVQSMMVDIYCARQDARRRLQIPDDADVEDELESDSDVDCLSSTTTSADSRSTTELGSDAEFIWRDLEMEPD